MRRFILPLLGLFIAMFALEAVAADAPPDSKKGAATRKMLKQKVTLNFKNDFLKDILEEIQDQVKGIKFRIDLKGGVSQNKRMTIACKGKVLEEALGEMLGKEDLGFFVISDTKNAYDGSVFIRMGKERGYPAGDK